MGVTPLERNNVQLNGAGQQPMMFAHGFGCDQTMWRFLIPYFEDRFQVVSFDYVGCGQSDFSEFDAQRYSSLQGYAREVVEIARAANLKDIIFVGHSVSSMIGYLAARMAPDLFSHLILIVPSACYINEPPHYEGGFAREDLEGLLDLMEKNDLGWAGFLAPLVMQNADRPELSQELQDSFCAADPTIARRFAETTFLSDNRKDLSPIDPPPLIIQCRDDRIAPRSAIEFVHQKLDGSTLECLPIGGHCPHMTHPAETAAAIDSYLRREKLPRTP
ncbi:alpha/beta hydrolase [Roseibacillus persicicus]|uniref:alpha/beta fold hydrolase n=1 Tax=Roseibacillus persicicus TaxID=454148 RepID=UPI00398A5311